MMSALSNTEWDRLKYHFDNYWKSLIKDGVDIKNWSYEDPTVKTLKLNGFEIDGYCDKCSICRKGEELDCKNPRIKYIWIDFKHKSGWYLTFRFNFSAGIDKGYVNHVALCKDVGDKEFIDKNLDEYDYEDIGKKLMLMPMDKFMKFVDEQV